ncbi:GNAT family N-acetyltransferase [Siccirubricoccus sp. G192]|uniref:GNAT family N-acetyltransferase n=1 Tax=Siccirubricoccus sp. G192 TaxID=2849651 RepID=UPI001C2B8754|nr:GNAT family N-acetyltransferase [Siccirubricoccus sp. G192]MBV1796468.1 GNAT family N-acetyltransferase [Siccirubricoccus sp. G192]
MDHRIVAVSNHPEFAPVVATWLIEAFENPNSRTVEEMTALILAPPVGPEETFVLLDRDRPVGTASLAHKDLETRPDLTPWLAGVFVQPAFRGRGYATTLVRRVEAFASVASAPALWLYTWTAEPLYARLGWQRVSLEMDPKRGREVVLMTRRLPSGYQASDFDH